MFDLRKYEFELTGKGSLLMHGDNFNWAAHCKAWSSKPENKKRCTAGDDRTPGFMWLGACYRGVPEGHNDSVIALPTALLSACVRDAGKMTQIPGQGKKTYKAQTQSGMQLVGTHMVLENNGRVISWTDIAAALSTEFDFEKHTELVEAAGFKLNVQRVKVGQSRHIRVRPEFDKWVVRGTLLVQDDQLDETVVRMLITNAGTYKGLGDWRPGAPTPGPHGTFELTKLEEV